MNILQRIKEKILSIVLPRIKSSGYYAVRSIFKDLKVLVDKENPVIIDGGANFGETTDEFLLHFKDPKVYCFEANSNLAEKLSTRFSENKNIKIIPKAIGNKNTEVNFNISRNLPSSSFLETTGLYKEYHGETTKTEEVTPVKMITLDSFFEGAEVVDILKLDVEGYELEVLKGAENMLSNVRVIMTEVWFSDGYESAPYFSDIDIYLREHGFALLNIYNPYTHKDMQLTAGDAVFLNKKFFNDRKHFG